MSNAANDDSNSSSQHIAQELVASVIAKTSSPTSASEGTGLNFVLQNVGTQDQGQYQGLATLGRLLGDDSNSNMAPSSSAHMQATQRPDDASPKQEEEQLQQKNKNAEDAAHRSERLRQQDDNVHKLMSGMGEWGDDGDDHEHGLFVFTPARVATGEALHRVFELTNKTNPTAKVLVPQIAPQLAVGFKDKKRNKKGGGGGGGAGGDSSSSPNDASVSKSGDNEGDSAAPYQCYSGRNISHASHPHASSSNNKDEKSQSSQAGGSYASKQQSQSSGAMRPSDRFGLHALFDACKETVEARPRRLPRLHIAGTQREVGDRSVPSSSSVAAPVSPTSPSSHDNNDGDDDDDEKAAAEAAASPVASPREHLTVIGAAGGPPRGAQSRGVSSTILSRASHAPTPSLVSWVTPWPFQLDRLVMASGIAAQQRAMDSFMPISPIFTEAGSSAVGLATSAGESGSIAAEVRSATIAYKKQQQAVDEQKQREQDAEEEAAFAASQGEQAEDEDQHAAHELRQALAEKHADDGAEEERPLTGDDDSAAAPRKSEHKTTSLNNSSSGNKPSPPKKTVGSKKQPHPPGAARGGGFLPRQFKVAPIPGVLPSLLTVTSARGGVTQQQQQQQQQHQSSEENVDWGQNGEGAGADAAAAGDQQQQQSTTTTSGRQQHQPTMATSSRSSATEEGFVVTARMRNKLKHFTGGASSTLGALVPLELQTRGHARFPKHRDVRRIESKSDKLKAELEHFATMRRIRTGYSEGAHKGEAQTARSTFRQNVWDKSGGGGDGGKTAESARSSQQQQQQQPGGRPHTPPKSFLALHGLRAGEGAAGAQHGTPSLPPVRLTGALASELGTGHRSTAGTMDGTFGATGASGGGGGMTVMSHPPVPWSRQLSVGGSVAARYTQGKYNAPDRAQVVAALMNQ